MKQNEPILADFGLSSFVPQSKFAQNKCGSFVFVAPEVFSQESWDTFAADIFSLGVTFYQVATKKLPWDGCDMNRVELTNDKNLQNIDHELADLIIKMTSFNPARRPTISQVLQHPYFGSYNRKLVHHLSLHVQPSCLPRINVMNRRPLIRPKKYNSLIFKDEHIF